MNDNDIQFQSAFDRLVKYYEPYAKAGHSDSIASLRDLNNLVKDRENQRLLITLRENPWGERIYKFTVQRYKDACARQMGKQIRTQLEQKADSIDKDWALFYISMLGGEPDKVVKQQTDELLQQVVKLKL